MRKRFTDQQITGFLKEAEAGMPDKVIRVRYTRWALSSIRSIDGLNPQSPTAIGVILPTAVHGGRSDLTIATTQSTNVLTAAVARACG
jgi:hypothetical protein